MLNLLSWIIVGLIAGALADYFLKSVSYGLVGKLVLGILGGLVGGFIFHLFGLGANGFIGEIIVSFIGAVILVWVVGLFTNSKGPAAPPPAV